MERVKQLKGFMIKRYSKRECENYGIPYDLNGRIYGVFRGETYLEEKLLLKEAEEFCISDCEAKKRNDKEKLVQNKQKEYFAFLNALRDSCVTNMFGATPYLVKEFKELNENSARKVLSDWMKSFK